MIETTWSKNVSLDPKSVMLGYKVEFYSEYRTSLMYQLTKCLLILLEWARASFGSQQSKNMSDMTTFTLVYMFCSH